MAQASNPEQAGDSSLHADIGPTVHNGATYAAIAHTYFCDRSSVIHPCWKGKVEPVPDDLLKCPF